MNTKKILLIGLAAVFITGGVVLAVMSDGGETVNETGTTQQMEKMKDKQESDPSAESTDGNQAVSATEVMIEDYAYSPVTIKVKVGDTVTWTNQDSVSHDVIDDNSSADGPKSDLLDKGESYSFKFAKAGTYSYHCSPHPYMKATVIVE